MSEDRPRLLDWIDLPPIWLVAAILLTRLLAGLPDGLLPAPTLRVGAQILIAAGFALMATALIQLIRHRTTPVPHQTPTTLVTAFPFSISRNPIYLGDVLVLVGATLWWASLWALLLLVPAFLLLITRRFIAREEKRLATLAPEAWASYAARVRRWL